MAVNLSEPVPADLTIQQLARRSGLSNRLLNQEATDGR